MKLENLSDEIKQNINIYTIEEKIYFLVEIIEKSIEKIYSLMKFEKYYNNKKKQKNYIDTN